MLTKVILDGPMGKKFGREWHLDVNSPAEALRLIDANSPGVFRWIRANLEKYSSYRVICEYEDARTEELENETYSLERKLKSVRYVPIVEGAGGFIRVVFGAILLALSFVQGFQWLAPIGISLIVGGVIEMLTPTPKKDSQEPERKDKTSYYFNGAANTTIQGVPVQLIYGKVLVGSHAISAAITVDQLI